jgi:UDP-GlcNAc3NAcA epimerase
MNRPLHILTVVGARPQIIKAAAVSRAVASTDGLIKETIVHTGQHYDNNMSQVFFDELGIPRPDIMLDVGSGSHGVQTARMLEKLESCLLERKPDVVLLYGDTNSTLAGAIAASKLHIPIAHVEAGLRSFNKRMPEEVNRIVCDHTSTFLFCPTETAVAGLRREGFDTDYHGPYSADKPFVSMSGDVMFDNTKYFAELAKERSTILQDHSLNTDEFVLATVHRDHNTDDPVHLRAIFEAFLNLVKVHGLKVVLPLHPRTKKCMDTGLDATQREEIDACADLILIPPVGFLDMIALESNARLVMTDSGGVQKEAFFCDRPCVIIRPETEWVELVENGQAILTGADPVRIQNALDHFISNGKPACPPLFGDGHAAERICQQLLEAFVPESVNG